MDVWIYKCRFFPSSKYQQYKMSKYCEDLFGDLHWNKHLNHIQYVFLANHISNMNEFVLKFISEGSSSSGGLMLKSFIFI